MTLETRLSRIASDIRIDVVHPEQLDRKLHVQELDAEGKAEILVEIPAGRRGITLDLHGHKRFTELASSKSADGSLLLEDDDGWVAIVIECKKSLNPNVVVKASEQIRSGVNRLAMMAALLELPVQAWHTFIATRGWSASSPSDPALTKLPISSSERQRLTRHSLEEGTAVVDDTAAGSVTLGLIALDGEGTGTLRLPVPSPKRRDQKNESG